VRKVPVIPAVLGAALLLLSLPTMLEARPARGRVSHRSATRHDARKTVKKPKPLIRQNEAGEVVIDRVEVAGLSFYGPPSPEKHNYPQPLCDPVDMVAEVWVHDADSGNPDTLELETAEVTREVTDAEARHGLSRIAHKLGSFFRPKSAQASVRPEDVNLDVLLSQRLLIPVEGVDIERLRDSFLSERGKYAKHLAIDIGSPRGTPVLASTDGRIVKVTREKRGGKSIYQKDATGKYLLFYCHLSGYAENLVAGKEVHKGEVIGYVGATGHVIGGSHLHFSITRVPEDSGNFKAGLAINPYLLFLAGVP
jgi:murein DD-endopeptidase MepM/ murein hydrolase activator NlpD